MSYKYRPYQQDLHDRIFSEWDSGNRNVLTVSDVGTGKCLGKDTPVLMFDGTVKMVQDVVPGDELMGPDSKVRNVLSTCSGEEQLYKVTPVKGDPYIVNESHILSIKRTRCHSIVNISLLDFLARPKGWQADCKGWRAGVEFPRKSYSDYLPPYMLGLWLGDGTSRESSITSADQEVVDYITDFTKTRGLRLRIEDQESNCKIYHIRGGDVKNLMQVELQSNDLILNKHIPHQYKTGDRQQRLELLAGILDSDGYLSTGGYDVVFKSKELADDVAYLARSLGFASYPKSCLKKCTNTGAVGTYWRQYISGDVSEIPTRLKRHQPEKRKQKKSVLVTGIKIEKLEVGEYYGFSIDGDRLFMLGDFTVTHNTVVISNVIRAADTVTYAIAHRQELVSQMSCALAENGLEHNIIAPTSTIKFIAARHVKLFGRTFYKPSSKFNVAGVDTIIRRDLPNAHKCGLWIIDEAHHVVRENKWGKAVAMFPNALGLGVTATPCRADGNGLGSHADGVFDTMVVNRMQMAQLILDGYLTPFKILAPPVQLGLTKEDVGSTGDYKRPRMVDEVRKSSILGDVVSHYLTYAAGKIGVTFATDIKSAEEMCSGFNAAGVPAAILTGTTGDKKRSQTIDDLTSGKIKQLINVDIVGEGFNLPAIEVVSFARPTASYGLYCLDPETEVLTPSGWRRCNDEITEVIAFNTESEKCSTVDVSGRVIRPLYPDEEMFGISSPHLDICVSDRHDMLVKGRGDTCLNWMKQVASDVAKRKSMFRVPVSANGHYSGSGLSVSELHLIGWYLSDGSINRKTNALTICQSVKKTLHVNHIRSSIEGCEFKYGERINIRKNVPETHNDLKVFTVSKGSPRGSDKHLTGWDRLSEWLDKSVPAIYDTLTREELLTMIEAINLGDGANNHNSLDYNKRTLTIACGDNEAMADRLQALCVTRGLRCNKKTVNYTGNDWYVLHIRDCSTATIAGKNVRDGKILNKKYKRSRFEKMAYKPEFVWCLTNELGTLITRRNGKVSIVGNCQQFGRALRLMDGKDTAIILDHVGNVIRHGLPTQNKVWTLDRRDRKASSNDPDSIPLKNCLECLGVYEAFHKACPYCGHVHVPADRSRPEFVDGDLTLLDFSVIDDLHRQIAHINKNVAEIPLPISAGQLACKSVQKKHRERQEAQEQLREIMAIWSGAQRDRGLDLIQRQRLFFHRFGVDVLTAQTLGRGEAEKLMRRIENERS